MSKDLLWEIGVEEIPARFLPPAIEQIEQLAKDTFDEAGLDYEKMHVYATPRRLTLMIDGLAEKACDRECEVKGPAKKTAFDETGRPTQALLGFCRSQGIEPAQLIERELNGNVYMYVRKKCVGRESRNMLPELLLSIGEKLYFPKPMRWGYNTLRFARPIRWMVALFGPEIIDISFGGITADRYSRGHRLLGDDHIKISEPSAYKEALRVNYVIVDQQERREMCRRQIAEVAASCGGRIKEDEELLTEVTYLLEYPTALSGAFEAKYLALPEELVTTPMVDQQRYFPVYDEVGKLLPRFITVRNGDSRYLDIVAAGNEKVLRSRLADAEFFYKEDLKDNMDNKVEELASVVFHEKLGTLRQKVARLVELSEFLARALGYTPEMIELTRRAAYLSKADLGSRVVYEFPELQGIIGEYYAQAAGEDGRVSTAIREHYLPRFAGDELPESKIGLAVALADKIDSMTGFFALGMIPSGSQDPYALRRAAAGCAQIIMRHQLTVRFAEILPYALDLVQKDAVSLDTTTLPQRMAHLIAFINQRAETMLTDEGVGYDIINAVRETAAAANGDIIGMLNRARALQTYRAHQDFSVMLEALIRVSNILRSALDTARIEIAEVDEALFRDKSEEELFRQIQRLEKTAQPLLLAADYQGVLIALTGLAPFINEFFTAVMVMDDDPIIRCNRLALLQRILAVAGEIGDFSKIVA